jgi:purine-binding chemotaxis protein CheW
MSVVPATSGTEPGLMEILEERARALAEPIVEDQKDALDVVVLHIGDERYGLPVGSVVEVRPLKLMTVVPGLANHWVGIVNLRGSLFAVLDLRIYLGLPGDRADDSHMALITAGAWSAVVLADDIRTVVSVPRADIGLPVDSSSRVISGVTTDLISILDVDRLVSDLAPASDSKDR